MLERTNNGIVSLSDYSDLSKEIIANLSGDLGVWWLNLYQLLHQQKDPYDVSLWEPWKIISYGGPDLNSEKLRTLCSRDNKKALCVESVYFLKNLETTPKKKSASIIIAPSRMLGLNDLCSVYDLNKRVLELGFQLFTPELIYNLHYQISGSSLVLRIAMKPLPFPDGQKKTFSVGKVISPCSFPETKWISPNHWIAMVKEYL